MLKMGPINTSSDATLSSNLELVHISVAENMSVICGEGELKNSHRFSQIFVTIWDQNIERSIFLEFFYINIGQRLYVSKSLMLLKFYICSSGYVS